MTKRKPKQSSAEPERIESIERFLEVSELTGVRTRRVGGERISGEDPGEELDSSHVPEMHVFHRASEDQFEVRCVVKLHVPGARLLADVEVIFTFEHPVLVDDHVLEEANQRIGVMAAYPYLREVIQSTAARLGVAPPVMGLLRADQVSMDPSEVDSPDAITMPGDGDVDPS